MARDKGLMSPNGALRLLAFLGVLYVVLAIVQMVRALLAGQTLLDALTPLLLVGIPGALIAAGGYRLPDAGIREEMYPRVLGWALGGFGLMVVVVGLRVVSPGVRIDAPFWSGVLATAFGTVAGLAIGMYEGRAFSRARTAEQRSEELKQAKTQLQETVQQLRTSNERLERFAYATSHDLKEPLRMIATYVQLLDDRYAEDLDEEASEYIGFAADGAQRMQALIDSLLVYSGVLSKGGPMEPIDVEAVLDEVLHDLEPRIQETNATVTRDPMPQVRADPDQLAQVFANLLSNALTYSGTDAPRVHISAEDTGEAWRFAVADEGIGIDPAYHDRVFEMFERLPTEKESAEPGAGGFGLALAERIVERHGGEIWLDSEPGAGSTFSFTIPRWEGERPTTEDAWVNVGPSDPGSPMSG